jgi:rsbT antagonist protein RsbS
MRLSGADDNIVLQRVGNVVIVPLHEPVTQELLTALSDRLLALLHHGGPMGVIFDMSGVEILDEQDLNDLRYVVECASLMGAEVVLADINPGVAIGLTMLNVEDGWINATRTVDIAMESFA